MKKLDLLSVTLCFFMLALIPACSSSPSDGVKLTVACDATWPPFEIINEQTKELDGFGPELIRAIANRADLDIELVNVGFDSVLAGVSQCQYDMAVSSITITDDRKKTILFSDPYYLAGQIVTVRKDIDSIAGKDDLSGKMVGGQIGTTGIIEAGKIPGAKVKTFDEVGFAFQDLMNGQLDAVIADCPVARGYVLKNSDKLKTVGPIFTDEYYGIAICKKNAHLVPKINAALKALKDEGFLDRLDQKWVGR
ncbi:MAG: basic amino acid ABC transporter substrate-binding protein [Dehalococcoidia bacterium]|nr:basic amino acid ABC transporter substrate-binding protein [Dehalococcoidia bacterium]